MKSLRAARQNSRAIASAARRPLFHRQSLWSRHYSDGVGRRRRGGFVKFIAIFGLSAAAVYYYPKFFPSESPIDDATPKRAKVVPAIVEPEYEEARKEPGSKEENRELISPQHLQIKKSWENPGVYAWGSNVGKVIDPNSNDKYIKTPRRISYFDGQLLRDLRLSQTFGVAATENGDVVQWGNEFSSGNPAPVTTLKGKDIVKLDVSADRVIALSSTGAVFSLPVSRGDQESGERQKESSHRSWIPFWTSGPSGQASLNYRTLTPKGLSLGEKVTDISSGLEHCLMLTSKGRVFSAAASTTGFPSRGQMGIPGLTWLTRPEGPYDQAHEVSGLKESKIVQIAAGDYHSVTLDGNGNIYGFGDNTFGQLGIPSARGSQIIDAPAGLPVKKLYANTGLIPRVTAIAAGGPNTYFAVDADVPPGQELVLAKDKPKTRTELWACGQGNLGSLGNGKWTHISEEPTRVAALSSIFEFDDKSGKMVPIKLASLAVGTSHIAAVLGNATRASTSAKRSVNDTNFGADVLVWGGNEHFQLGTGKRTNVNTPTYIRPLDGDNDVQKGGNWIEQRLQIAPRATVRIGDGGKGRKAIVEQRVACGKYITAVYSGT